MEPYSQAFWSVPLVLLLTLLCGAFAMAESALYFVRRARIEQLVEEGNRAAVLVQRLIGDPPRFVAATQVGLTLSALAAVAVAASTLSLPLAKTFAFVGLSERWGTLLAFAIVTLIVVVLVLVAGEITPKALAAKYPEQCALHLSPLVQVCAWLFAPLTLAVVGLSDLLLRPFGLHARFEAPTITEEELKHIIDAGEKAGELEEDERVMLRNVFDLGETMVRSVMTPRIDMTALSTDATVDRLLQLIQISGHSRIPVYDEKIDNIVGIVHAKNLLPLMRDDCLELSLREILEQDRRHGDERDRVIRTPFFVPETKKVSELLAEFRRQTQQIAIVQDEYAGTEGIVTIEDLLEEIVGDIRDEYDVDEPEMVVLSETESLIDGRMGVADVNERLGIDLGHDYETMGGLVFGILGHEPIIGETVEQQGWRFVVETMEERRIKTVRAVKVKDMEDESENDS